MAEEVVRRSTPIEYLERIINSTDSEDKPLKDWAVNALITVRTEGLGNADDPIYVGVPEKAEKRYGLIRPPTDFSFDELNVFVDRVADTYRDAKWYPEFNGITISAEVNSLRGSSGSNSYEFKAGFGERVGLVDQRVCKTEFSFKYQHPQEEGRFDKERFIKGQLFNIAGALINRAKLKKNIIEILGSSIVVGKSNKE